MPRLVPLLLTPLLLSACHEACTDLAAASVQLSVVDPSGDPLEGAQAEYTILEEDWAAPEPCEEMEPGELICGWELEATFEIQVEAQGHSSEFLEVAVGADVCHVITEQREVELQPES